MPGRQRVQCGRRGAELERDLLRVRRRPRAVEDLRHLPHGLRLLRGVLRHALLVAEVHQRGPDVSGEPRRSRVAVVDVDRDVGRRRSGRSRARGRRVRVERVLYDLLDLRHVDDVEVLRRRVTRDRDALFWREGQGRETQVLPGQRAHARREVEQSELRVRDQVLARGAEQGVQLAKVAVQSLVLHVPDHVVEGGLLALRPA